MSEQHPPQQRPVDAKPRNRHVGFMVLVALLLVGGFAFYLAAVAERAPSKVDLAIISWNESSYWDLVFRGAEDAAKDHHVNLTTIRSKPDMETQSQHVRDLLAKGIDGIAITPNNPQAQAALLDEAAAKTALITYDSDAPNSKRRLFVGTDDYAAGQVAADEVHAALPDGGEVLISVGSIEMANGRDRRQGLIDDLLGRPFNRERTPDPLDAPLKGEKYSIVATVTDNGDTAKSAQLVADALKAHPNVKCVVGLFGYSAPAAMKAIEQAGKAGQVQVVAFDEAEETQKGIEAGTIRASILQDQYRIGYEAVRILAAEARGHDQRGPKGPRLTHMAIRVLDKNNLAEFRGEGRVRKPKAVATAQ